MPFKPHIHIGEKIIFSGNQIFKNYIQLFLKFTNDLVLIAMPLLFAVKTYLPKGENRDSNDMSRLR